MSKAARRALIASLLAATTVLIAGGLLVGPLAPVLAAALLDGRTIWRLGTLEVEGVSGPHLGALRIESASLADRQGVWLEAEDLSLNWRPWALLNGDALIDTAEAERLIVLRRPILGPPPPQPGPSFDVRLEALAIEELVLAKGVAGPEAAQFALSGALFAEDGRLADLRLTAEGGADSARIRFAAEPFVLDVAIRGGAKGALAALAGGPLEISATGAKNMVAARAAIAGTEALRLQGGWTEETYRLSATAELGAIPAAADLVQRLGPRAQFSIAGERPGKRAGPFTASLAAGGLRLEAAGRINADYALAGDLDVTATAPATLAGLDGGAITFTGALDPGAASRLNGELRLRDVRQAGLVLNAAGPLRLGMDRRAIDANLDLDGAARGQGAAQRVLGKIAIDLAGRYDRQDQSVTLRKLAIETPALRLTGAGGSEGKTGFAGDWRVRDARFFAPDWRGEAAGEWRLVSTPKAPWRLELEGAGRNLRSGQPALDQLLGPRPRIEAALAFAGDVISIEQVILNGRQLRVGASGAISDGEAAILLEASARGPLDLGAASLSGGVDATGRVAGPLNALRTSLNARLAQLDIAGLTLNNADVSLRLAPGGGGQLGALSVNGALAGAPLAATADLAIGEDRLALRQIAASLAQLRAQGEVVLAADGPRADLQLSGRVDGLAPSVSGAINGRAQLTDERLDLDLVLQNARFGQLRIQSARLDAQGPLTGATFQAAVTGATAARAPIQLNANGQVQIEPDLRATARLNGSVAGAPIASRAPIVFSAADGTRLNADLSLGDGGLALAYSAPKRGRLSAELRFENTPLSVLAALAGERAEGRINGAADLESRGGRLIGAAALALRDARLARRSAETIDADLEARLANERLDLALNVRSATGLRASLEADAAVATSANPLRIARAGAAPLTAEWAVDGPIAPLWAAFGSLDQQLSGQASGAGTVSFANKRISGEGALRLSGGEFEDRTTGVRLEALDAALSFDPSGLVLERLAATDGESGRLTGSGRIQAEGAGEIRLGLSEFRLLRREDVQARANGELQLTWSPAGGLLSGDIRILNAEVRPVSGRAAIPTIKVREINRPITLPPPPGERDGDNDSEQAELVGLPPIRLDVRVRGGERIYIRGRGLDSEWRLDARLGGTAGDIALSGGAELIRGDFDLAGRPFELIRGEVDFRGAIDATELDLVAERDVEGLTTIIQVTGTIENPNIELSSNPALPEDEILAQTLFGRDAETLSAVEAAQLAAGLASLTGNSALDIAGFARRAIALDRLEVREQDGGLLVAGGKYLSREVYLEVARGPLGEAQTSIEWQVRPRFYIISTFRQEAGPRVAVRWRRDY